MLDCLYVDIGFFSVYTVDCGWFDLRICSLWRIFCTFNRLSSELSLNWSISPDRIFRQLCCLAIILLVVNISNTCNIGWAQKFNHIPYKHEQGIDLKRNILSNALKKTVTIDEINTKIIDKNIWEISFNTFNEVRLELKNDNYKKLIYRPS